MLVNLIFSWSALLYIHRSIQMKRSRRNKRKSYTLRISHHFKISSHIYIYIGPYGWRDHEEIKENPIHYGFLFLLWLLSLHQDEINTFNINKVNGLVSLPYPVILHESCWELHICDMGTLISLPHEKQSKPNKEKCTEIFCLSKLKI